jgi:probable HAF family extracellular repeat protein
MQDLDTLPGGTDSAANAVSVFGYVVGWSNSATSTNLSHAFLWSPRTGMWDLNDLIPSNSGWVLLNATGINAWGQITGNGMINGEMHGYLLTPNL